MDVEKVKEHLASIAPHVDKWPPSVQSVLLANLARTDDDDYFIAIMNPKTTLSEFDPLCPTLGNVEIGDVEKARVFQRKVLNDRIIPLMAQAQHLEARLRINNLAAAIAKWEDAVEEEGAVLTSTLHDASLIARFLMLLISEDIPQNLDALDPISNATTGILSLVKEAAWQCKWLKDRASGLRRTSMALTTMVPEMQDAVQKLDASADEAQLRSCISKLPAWENALPEGSTAKVMSSLKACSKRVYSEANTPEKLQRFIDLMKYGLEMLDNPEVKAHMVELMDSATDKVSEAKRGRVLAEVSKHLSVFDSKVGLALESKSVCLKNTFKDTALSRLVFSLILFEEKGREV